MSNMHQRASILVNSHDQSVISESSEGPKKPIDLNRRQTVVNIKGDAIKNLASIFDKGQAQKQTDVEDSFDQMIQANSNSSSKNRNPRKTEVQQTTVKKLMSNISGYGESNFEVESVQPVNSFDKMSLNPSLGRYEGEINAGGSMVGGQVCYEYVPIKENLFVKKDTRRNTVSGSPTKNHAHFNTQPIAQKIEIDQAIEEVSNHDGNLPTIQSNESLEENVKESESESENEATIKSWSFDKNPVQESQVTQTLPELEESYAEKRYGLLDNDGQQLHILAQGDEREELENEENVIGEEDAELEQIDENDEQLLPETPSQQSFLEMPQEQVLKEDMKELREKRKEQAKQRKNFNTMASPPKKVSHQNKLILEEFVSDDCNTPAFVTNRRAEDKKNENILQEKLLNLEKTMAVDCQYQDSVALVSEEVPQIGISEIKEQQPVQSDHQEEGIFDQQELQSNKAVSVMESLQIPQSEEFKEDQNSLNLQTVISKSEWASLLTTLISDQEIRDHNQSNKWVSENYLNNLREKSKQLMMYQFVHKRYTGVSSLIEEAQ